MCKQVDRHKYRQPAGNRALQMCHCLWMTAIKENTFAAFKATWLAAHEDRFRTTVRPQPSSLSVRDRKPNLKTGRTRRSDATSGRCPAATASQSLPTHGPIPLIAEQSADCNGGRRLDSSRSSVARPVHRVLVPAASCQLGRVARRVGRNVRQCRGHQTSAKSVLGGDLPVVGRVVASCSSLP